ncbi:MAG TPA: HAD family hydrolase [Candidatus Desulfaltia sp.]|nr:HAD family hydrolase [Candidatus Desulfaltia sp.]
MYRELVAAGEAAYVREDSLDSLRQVDVVVFDCDGVLLDVRRSYIRAVARTVSLLVEAFTGSAVPEALFDPALNYAYKRTGGFNNDWSLAYALTMRTLAEAGGALTAINMVAEAAAGIQELPVRLEYIRCHRPEATIPVDGLYQKLYGFAGELDDTGHRAVDRLLGHLEPVKRALNYRAGVGESMVSTLFEEVLLGSRLFQEAFGLSASLASCDRGFVEDAEVVIAESTIRDLEALLGGRRLGVASGSIRSTAYHVLGPLAHMIPREAQVWHDDVDEFAGATGRGDLHKPNPYPLVAACEPYRPYRCVLYVGDTAADHLMARRAGEVFLFAGVYGVAHGVEETKLGFLEAKCDIVASNVNQLPGIMRQARLLDPGG